MRENLTCFTALSLCAGLGIAPATPAEQGTTPDLKRLETQIAEVNGSLRRIVTLMEGYLERQKLELLMKRVELSGSKLTQMEQELRRLTEEKADQEVEMARLQAALGEFDRLIRDRKEMNPGAPPAEAESERTLLLQKIKALEDKIWRLGERALELENAIAGQRRDLQSWETHLNERLKLP